MDTHEIEISLQILFKLSNITFPFFVTAADTLHQIKNIKKYPILIVQNTDRIKDPGQHWIAWFILSNTHAEYFDSYGKTVETYKNVEMPTSNIVLENCLSLQSPTSFVCGAYCIYYLYYRALGKSYKEILNSFSKNVVKNDRKVEMFVKSIHSVKRGRNGYGGSNKHKNIKCQNNTCKCGVSYIDV
jgi:hypothetical protein